MYVKVSHSCGFNLLYPFRSKMHSENNICTQKDVIGDLFGFKTESSGISKIYLKRMVNPMSKTPRMISFSRGGFNAHFSSNSHQEVYLTIYTAKIPPQVIAGYVFSESPHLYTRFEKIISHNPLITFKNSIILNAGSKWIYQIQQVNR